MASTNKQSIKRTNPPASKKKTKRRKKHPRLRLAFKIFFLLFLLTILAAMGIFYYKYGDTLLQWQADAEELVSKTTEDTFKTSEASFIYDSKGKAIAKLKGEKDSFYLEFDEIPQGVKDAFVVTEDRDFYEHSGYDLKAIASAGISLIKNKLKGEGADRGASTITQQLARNAFPKVLDYTDRSYSRKVKEIFIAMELERKYEKDQILEFYINNIYFGNGYYGIEAASRGYFNKNATKLTLSEIAFVCSIPNRPTLYDPFEHFDNTKSRKDRILNQLLSENYISAAEYSDARYQDIVLNPAQELQQQDYMTSYAISCATKALMLKQGFQFRYAFSSNADRATYDEEYSEVYDECNKSLYNSGYHIYTSLNKKKQRKLQKAVNAQLAAFTEKKKGMYALQGAATCINNKTGKVVAIVGGRSQKKEKASTLNRAYLSFRQPGSAFKPIAVYTPQLERDYTPNSIVDDTFFEGGPKNSNGRYSGKIPLRSAVEQSKNVIAWKLFEELTPATGLAYIQNMNFTKIVDDDFVPAAALGGLTKGVSTVEMASAYATLANSGTFRNPTCVVKITDSEGNVIIGKKLLAEQKQVYKEDAANTMTNILEGVMIRGTAAGKGLTNMSSAGKTGTTSDKKDGWFCGYTPYYSTAVWVGYDTPRTLDNLYGSTYPLYIWRQFMEEIHAGLEDIGFAEAKYKDKNRVNKVEETVENLEPTDEPEETIDPDAIDETTPTEDVVTTENPVEPTQEPVRDEPAQTPSSGTEGEGGYEDVGDEVITEDVGGITQ